MKKKYVLIGLIMLLFSLMIPSFTQAAEKDPHYDKIIQKKKLVVGLSPDYPPYEFITTVDGKEKVVGFDVSIAQKIADDMGVELKIQQLGFDALLGSLKTGKIDIIISGMSPTPERLKEVSFSDPYLKVDQKVLIRKKDANTFNSLDAFAGRKVGAQKQTIQEELAHNELTDCQVVSLQKVPDIILNLQNGKIDGAVMEAPVAEAYVSQDKNIAIADFSFKNGMKQAAVAFAKDAPILAKHINGSIQTINDDNLLPTYKQEANKLMFSEDSFWKKYLPYYLTGTGYTILIALVGVLFGALLGGILALLKLSTNRFLRGIANIYIEFVRGTPLLVQIFLVYFGTATLGLELNALVSGCVAMSLNSGAYVAEIIRAGIIGINKGQTEAARSLGMNQQQTLRFIIMPQAIKNILPALGNEFVTVIKESSVVSVIGVSELMFQAGVVQGASFKPFLPILIASGIYFVLTFSLSRLLGVAERKFAVTN